MRKNNYPNRLNSVLVFAAVAACGGEMPLDTETMSSSLSATIAQWTFTSPNSIQTTLGLADVEAVVGDFDRNGRDDFALISGGIFVGYNSQFSTGSYWTNGYVDAGFDNAFDNAKHIAVGDFNGDDRDDIALLGAHPTVVDIAYGKAGGGFDFLTRSDYALQYWASQPGAQVATGDFDRNGRDDIAIAGGSGWTSIVVALSSSNGSFSTRFVYAPQFAAWAADPGAQLVSGNFDGDPRDDLAVVGGQGHWLIGLALARYDRTTGLAFAETTRHAPWVVNLAKQPHAKVLVGDFDRDDDDDFAVVGAAYASEFAFGFQTGSTITEELWNGDPSFVTDAKQARFVLAGALGPSNDDIFMLDQLFTTSPTMHIGL